jgi:hypothetical protein
MGRLAAVEKWNAKKFADMTPFATQPKTSTPTRVICSVIAMFVAIVNCR